MENKVTVQLEEISIEKVCRTCLNTSDESMISLFDNCDEELEEKLNFFQLINETFGRIMPSSQNLPNRLCSQCTKIVKKAYNFKKQCNNSTHILSEALDPNSIFGLEDKYTQTDQQYDQYDENFDAINLQEDVIFDGSQANNPLSLLNAPPICQETAEEIKADDEQNIEVDYLHQIPEESDDSKKTENEYSNYESPLNERDSEEDENNSKRVHECDKCGKSFTRQTHLKRHKLTHSEEKSLFCAICSKGFTRLDQLNHHMLNNHSDSKPFRCDVADCKKGFIKEEHLKKHIEAKHTEIPKEVCEICQKTFSSKKYLKTHMKVHNNVSDKGNAKKDPNNEKPYLCSECGLRFVRNDYLVIHTRRHQGLKPYKCRFCDKGFPRATDLTVHERYHTNEKTHLCTTCGKGFQRAYNLLVHMRVHTGEKPYSCSYCLKSFSQGNDLKAHIRRHTGERFKCDLCSEGFIQGYHLRNHKKAVHGIDIKSHIRRVEKFVGPSSNSDIVAAQNEQEVKLEAEYQVVEIQN